MFLRSFTSALLNIFFFKQKTAYEMRISYWSSDVYSSDLRSDYARGQFGGVMEGQRVVRLGKARVEPVLEHGDRAKAHFLRRLADHHQRARPVGLARRHQPGGLDPGGHLRVVPAGVPDAAFHPGSGDPALLRGAGRGRLPGPSTE